MDGSTGKGSDVDEALELFVGGKASKRVQPVVEQGGYSREKQKAKEKSRRKNMGRETKKEESKRESTTTGFVGRFPGSKNGSGKNKSKTTLRINTGLLEEYRNQVFEQRLPLGELIEIAMREHRDRTFGKDL